MTAEQILAIIVGQKVSIDWHNGLSISYADKSGKVWFLRCASIEQGLAIAVERGHLTLERGPGIADLQASLVAPHLHCLVDK
jgi:hypothetical protein